MLMPDKAGTRAKAYLAKYCKPIACPEKGSALRPTCNGGYRSLIAIGGPVQTAIAAGAVATLTWVISEAGHLGRLIITAEGEADEVAVTGIVLNNDPLTSGAAVPVGMFAHTSFFNPVFGHWVNVSDSLSVSFINNDAAEVNILAAWTAL